MIGRLQSTSGTKRVINGVQSVTMAMMNRGTNAYAIASITVAWHEAHCVIFWRSLVQHGKTSLFAAAQHTLQAFHRLLHHRSDAAAGTPCTACCRSHPQCSCKD